MKARVEIRLKQGVLDPQGQAVERALAGLGFGGARDVRMGKLIELTLDAGDHAAAEAQVQAMCEQLLANTVIESYRYTLD